MDRKHGAAAGQPYDLARIQSQLPSETALVTWIDLGDSFRAADHKGEHLACLVRRSGDPVWVPLRGRGAGGAWTPDDDRLAPEVTAALRTRPEGGAATWKAKAGTLATQRLDPLDPHLGPRGDLPAVKHLVILTSPRLAGIPIEALLEARPPDRPRYTVSYAPSGTIFAWLRERPRPRPMTATGPRHLLALGDPRFEPSDPSRRPCRRRPITAC